jgi:hypothetical protein
VDLHRSEHIPQPLVLTRIRLARLACLLAVLMAATAVPWAHRRRRADRPQNQEGNHIRESHSACGSGWPVSTG